VINLLLAVAIAAPTLSSITPASSPVTGGVRVVIRGSGFSNLCTLCSPPGPAAPFVAFGNEQATDVKFIDATTLEAVTPPNLPGTVTVSVGNRDGSGNAQFGGFTYTGSMTDAFEPLLFPIFTRPVRGAFGSEFRTTARIFPIGPEQVRLYGQDLLCYLIDPPIGPDVARLVTGEVTLLPDCNPMTGRILWTPKGTASSLAANIRVADVSREATSHGTEIPVVRQNEFTTGPIALLGVPTDPRFRLTLRIYSLAQTSGPVFVDGYGQVFLTPGRDQWEPSYAQIGDLPRTLTRVYIHPTGNIPLWALITVTNNETQQITTITPQ
jgi:IPT/TIG domain